MRHSTNHSFKGFCTLCLLIDNCVPYLWSRGRSCVLVERISCYVLNIAQLHLEHPLQIDQMLHRIGLTRNIKNYSSPLSSRYSRINHYSSPLPSKSTSTCEYLEDSGDEYIHDYSCPLSAWYSRRYLEGSGDELCQCIAFDQSVFAG